MTRTTFWWLILAASLASRSKRLTNASSCARAGISTLTAPTMS